MSQQIDSEFPKNNLPDSPYDAGFKTVLDDLKLELFDRARWLTEDDYEAEELWQLFTIRLFEKYSQFKRARNLKSFSYRVLTTMFIDQIRFRNKKSSATVIKLTEEIYGGLSNEDDSYQKEQNEKAVGYLLSLPDDDLNLLVYFEVEGLTANEVGDILNIEAAAAQQRKQRLLKKIRKFLSKK